jgi:hypothetical protein
MESGRRDHLRVQKFTPFFEKLSFSIMKHDFWLLALQAVSSGLFTSQIPAEGAAGQ